MTVKTDQLGGAEMGGKYVKKFLVLVTAVTLITILGSVLLSTHAEKHSEADLIRQTCHEHGPDEIWQEIDHPSVFIWLVHLLDDKWGCWFVQEWPSDQHGERVEYRERTAFCPRNGLYESVVCYLEGFATRVR